MCIRDSFNSHLVRARHRKEANAYPLLGMFSLCIAKELTNNISGHQFKIDTQFPVVKEKVKFGVKPSCDAATCAIVSLDGDLSPVILYEYKPTVDRREDHVDPHDLMEVVLQGYYCLRQYSKQTILHCLMDLTQFCYFKVDGQGQQFEMKLKYTWYKSMYETELSIESHLKFLQPIVKDMLNEA